MGRTYPTRPAARADGRDPAQFRLGPHTPIPPGNNFGVLVLSQTPTAVELQCSGCGARHTVERFRTESVSGRVRCEPELGQWLPCPACQDWSPVEAPPDQPAPVARSVARR